jgi:hypothetical protein
VASGEFELVRRDSASHFGFFLMLGAVNFSFLRFVVTFIWRGECLVRPAIVSGIFSMESCNCDGDEMCISCSESRCFAGVTSASLSLPRGVVGGEERGEEEPSCMKASFILWLYTKSNGIARATI